MLLRPIDYWLPKGRHKAFYPGDCIRVVNGSWFGLGGVLHIDAVKMAGQRVFLDVSTWEGSGVTGRKHTILVEGRRYRSRGIDVQCYGVRRARARDFPPVAIAVD